MPYKNLDNPESRQKAREARLRHYYKNKQSYIERTRKHRKEVRAYIKLLKSKPCIDCKTVYPYYVMDFDHKDPFQKFMPVSRMLGWPLSKVKEEIEKCDLVCSNCHRIRTHGRRSGITEASKTS